MTGLFTRRTLIAAAMLGLPLTLSAWPPAAAAESTCKGLEKPACDRSSACRWIDGYTRKDGKAVDGYCRIGSSQKSPTERPSKSQKDG